MNGGVCLVSGTPGISEEDHRLSLDKTGEWLVDPSQWGSIVHYQGKDIVSVVIAVNSEWWKRGLELVGSFGKWVKGLKAAFNSLGVET